jgi:ATP-dependent protease ClpP protease subunit
MNNILFPLFAFLAIIFFNYDNIMSFFRTYKLRHVSLMNDSMSHIILNGQITSQLIKDSIKKLEDIKNNQKITLIINSEGGDFSAGIKFIIAMVNMSNTSFECYVVNQASSTAFDIFQYCDKRYVQLRTKLFQHQTELTLRGTYAQIDAYFKNDFYFDKHMDEIINYRIAKKIKMNYDDYIDKINNNWTIYGDEIIHYGLADEIVYLPNINYLLKNKLIVH